MGAQAILDVSPPPRLCPQLHRLEPVHVLSVEEHEPDRADALVHVEGVAGEDRPLHHHPVGISGEQGAGGEQGLPAIWQLLEHKNGGGWEADGGEGGHDYLPFAEPPFVLVLVAMGVLGEGGAGGEPPPSTLEHQARLGLDRAFPSQGALPHHHVEDGHAVLMREKGRED